MKKIAKHFSFLTTLVALFALLTVAAYADETPKTPDVVFATETQLTVYVDNQWSSALSGSYGFGDTATLTAPAVSGKTFSHWTADGSIVSYANPLKLTMNAHTTLYAVYANAAPTAKPVAGFTSITRTNDGTKISFQAIAYPNDATVTGAGIVYSTTATGEALTDGGTGVTNETAVKSTDLTNTLPKSVLDNNNCWMLQITPDIEKNENKDTVYHARAYVTASGTTTYGDEKTVKLSELNSGISLVANPGSIDPENSLDTNNSLDNLLANLMSSTKTITYDANGGVGATMTQVFLPDQSVTLNANTFTREGYSFVGWNTAADGTGTSYKDKESITSAANLTLYAAWGSTVGFDANGGTGTMEDVTGIVGKYTLPDCAFIAPYGKTFDEWEINGTQYAAGAEITVTAATTVKALWATAETGGEATFVPEKGNNIQGIAETVSDSGASSLNDALGEIAEEIANESADDSTSVTVRMELTAEPDLSSANDADLSVDQKQKKAVQVSIRNEMEKTFGQVENVEQDFISIDIKVTETNENGTATTEQKNETPRVLEIPLSYNMAGRYNPAVYRYHDSAAAALRRLASRPRDYQTLDGCFYVSGSGNNVVIYIYSQFFSTYAVASTETESYTVLYDANGGAGDMDHQTGAAGSTVTLASNGFARNGYTFTGWNTAADGSGTSYQNGGTVTLDADITLYAQWRSTVSDYTPPSSGRDYRDSSSSDSSVSYSHTVNESDHGTVHVTPTAAVGGSKVTITARPDSGYTVDTVTVTDARGQSVSVTKVNDTTYTFSQPESKVDIVVTFRQTAAPAPVEDVFDSFKDLDKDAWYREGVMYALENGIMSGMGDGTFAPNGTASRAMIAQILWNMEGKPAVDYAMSYGDVNADAWYSEAIRWATAEGIMGGYSDSAFGPEDSVTREQLAAILYRYAQRKGIDVSISEETNLLSYDDTSDVSDWAVSAVQWTIGSGLITGRTASTLNPRDTATRAEIATIIMRYCTEVAN